MASPTLRVGVVPYLNMHPLAHGMPQLRLAGEPAVGIHVEGLPPSRMIEEMDAGRIDLGMAPVGALVERPSWKIATDAVDPATGGIRLTGIGSRGPVRSVLLLTGGPAETIRRLRPDRHSRSSNVLARIVLARAYGVEPEIGDPIPLTGWRPDAPSPEEGIVLIGSRALVFAAAWRASGGQVLDLGAAWRDLTGLPFVYAVWAAREGLDAERLRLPEWMAEFDALKRRNMARLTAIVPEYRGEERLAPRDAVAYLTRNIRFDLDETDLRGLERYFEEGRALGLFPEGWELARALGGLPEEAPSR